MKVGIIDRAAHAVTEEEKKAILQELSKYKHASDKTIRRVKRKLTLQKK